MIVSGTIDANGLPPITSGQSYATQICMKYANDTPVRQPIRVHSRIGDGPRSSASSIA